MAVLKISVILLKYPTIEGGFYIFSWAEFSEETSLKTFLTLKKWVKSIQTAGYNGMHTVVILNTCSRSWFYGFYFLALSSITHIILIQLGSVSSYYQKRKLSHFPISTMLTQIRNSLACQRGVTLEPLWESRTTKWISNLRPTGTYTHYVY